MNYYQYGESVGNQYFIKLNKQYKLFDEIKRNNLYDRIDWICKRKNKLYNCELKVRKSFDYPSIFIEPKKYEYLMKEYKEKNIVPFYINFCKDECYIWDLRKVFPTDEGIITIWDIGAQKYKNEQRLGLLKKDAKLLKLNG